MTTIWSSIRLDARSSRRLFRAVLPILIVASVSLVHRNGFATAGPTDRSAVARTDPGDLPNPAAQLSRYPIDDADPSSSLPDAETAAHDPLQFGYLIMDLADRADKAIAAKDYARAARYYKAVVKAAPDRAIGYSKLCQSYAGMGDLVTARDVCYEGLFHPGTQALDYLRYLRLLLDTKKQFDAEDTRRADAVFLHLKEEKIEAEEVYDLECEVALRLDEAHRLEDCAKALVAKWPDDPKTITYEWSLSLRNKDFGAAEKLVQRAKGTTMAAEGIRKMESATLAMQDKARPRYLIAAAAMMLVVLLVVSVRQLRSPNPRSA